MTLPKECWFPELERKHYVWQKTGADPGKGDEVGEEKKILVSRERTLLESGATTKEGLELIEPWKEYRVEASSKRYLNPPEEERGIIEQTGGTVSRGDDGSEGALRDEDIVCPRC